jgi:hypothetical protein
LAEVWRSGNLDRFKKCLEVDPDPADSLTLRIFTESLAERRAEYGKLTLATLSKEFVSEFGNGLNFRGIAVCPPLPSPSLVTLRLCKHLFAENAKRELVVP